MQAIDKVTLRSRHANALEGLLSRINFYERCGALDEALGGVQLAAEDDMTGLLPPQTDGDEYSVSDTLVGYLRRL
jgi:hypothetical protein